MPSFKTGDLTKSFSLSLDKGPRDFVERWCSELLLLASVREKDSKGKTVFNRYIYTDATDLYSAKNRHGLPPKIAIPKENPAAEFMSLIKKNSCYRRFKEADV